MNYRCIHIILVFIGLSFDFITFAQDTIQLDRKSIYYSDTVGALNYKSSLGHHKFNYSRELIYFSSDSAKLEYCYYYNYERIYNKDKVYSFTRKKDSIIEIKCNTYKEEWIYNKINDTLYSLTQYYNNLVEKGYAKSIIPLEKTGAFFVQNLKEDTIWKTKYIDYIIPEISLFNDYLIDPDSVFVIVDSMPIYNHGNSDLRIDFQKNLTINYPFFENEGICSRYFLSFIIDKSGELINIKFVRSCGNSFVERSILISIMNLKLFEPGKMKGKPVNVEMIFPILLHFQ